MLAVSLLVVPANAGTHGPLASVMMESFRHSAETIGHGVWVTAFAGTTRG